MDKRRLVSIVIGFMLSFSIAYAIDWRFSGFSGVSNVLGRFFSGVQSLLQNQVVVYGFTLVFFFIMLYGILAAALGKVNIFKGGKGGLNKRGKIVAVGMALLTVIAIFWSSDPVTVVKNILAPFGILAGLLLAIVMFLIVYKGFESDSGEKSWKMGLAMAGLAMVFAGMITSHPNIMWWGWLIFLIGAIIFISGAFGSGKADEGYGTPETFSIPPKQTPSAPTPDQPAPDQPDQPTPTLDQPTPTPDQPTPTPGPPDQPVTPPTTPTPPRDVRVSVPPVVFPGHGVSNFRGVADFFSKDNDESGKSLALEAIHRAFKPYNRWNHNVWDELFREKIGLGLLERYMTIDEDELLNMQNRMDSIIDAKIKEFIAGQNLHSEADLEHKRTEIKGKISELTGEVKKQLDKMKSQMQNDIADVKNSISKIEAKCNKFGTEFRKLVEGVYSGTDVANFLESLGLSKFTEKLEDDWVKESYAPHLIDRFKGWFDHELSDVKKGFFDLYNNLSPMDNFSFIFHVLAFKEFHAWVLSLEQDDVVKNNPQIMANIAEFKRKLEEFNALLERAGVKGDDLLKIIDFFRKKRIDLRVFQNIIARILSSS